MSLIFSLQEMLNGLHASDGRGSEEFEKNEECYSLREHKGVNELGLLNRLT